MIIIQGHVESVRYDGSRAEPSYSFAYGDETFGGTARVKRRALGDDWAEGQPIDVIFDPLYPNRPKVSTLVERSSLTVK